MEIGMLEYDDVILAMGTLSLDFSKLEMAEVYVVQYAAATEIRLRENVVAYQSTKNKRKEKECKVQLRENEQEIEGHEQTRLALMEAIKSAVTEFLVEEGHENEDAAAKVSWLSWIAMDLRKQVEELQT